MTSSLIRHAFCSLLIETSPALLSPASPVFDGGHLFQRSIRSAFSEFDWGIIWARLWSIYFSSNSAPQIGSQRFLLTVRFLAHGSECRVCDAARKFLSNSMLPFEEFDIDRNPSALQELVERTGSATHVPVIIVGEETFIDFNEETVTRILELLKQPTSAPRPNRERYVC